MSLYEQLLQGSLWDIAKRIKSLQTNQVEWREESDKRYHLESLFANCAVLMDGHCT